MEDGGVKGVISTGLPGRSTKAVRNRRRVAQADKPFIAWDGEACVGENGYHPYSLFGCGPRHYVSYFDISTKDCLDCIYTGPPGIHVSFAFSYDVNMILRDLSPKQFSHLKETSWTHHGGYNIQHIPRKWFLVSKRKRTVKIFDLFGFFMSSFEVAIKKYEVGSQAERDLIRDGKADRSLFEFGQMMSKIFPYWAMELEKMVELAEKLRSIIYRAEFNDMDFKITSWHGPSAIAGHVMKKQHAELYRSTKDNTPPEVMEASRYAYFGGRFQPFRAGLYEGPIYTADINTAYGWSNARLPNLASGRWRYENPVVRDNLADVRCGLYHLRFNLGRTGSNWPMPLPHRDQGNRISFPEVTEGWYHASEAYNVRNSEQVEFLEAWIYEDDGTYPFAWFEDMYQERLLLQRQGDPAEKALKWAIASAYGLRAQRVGWDKEKKLPPRFHDLIAAGMITAECRSLVHFAALAVARNCGLISIDTDGVISTVPFGGLPNGVGDGLGQWKIEEYTGILYYQNGVYWLRDQNGDWLPPKTRGIPRKKLPFDLAIDALRTNRSIRVASHTFTGYGLASRRQWRDWRKWIDSEREYAFGGNGKSFHAPRLCRLCQSGGRFDSGLHDLTTIPPRSIESKPHSLPWLDGEPMDEDSEWREFNRWVIQE